MTVRRLLSIPRSTWILLLVGVLLLPAPAHGQIDSWGVKAGVTSMTGSGEGLLDEGLGRNTGFLIGGTAQIGIVDFLSVRPELLLVRKGWSASFRSVRGNDISTTVNLDYLELPLLADAEIATIRGITTHVQAGPTLGVMIHSGESVEGNTEGVPKTDPGDAFKQSEIGLAVGGGASGEVGGQSIRVDVRYRLSLTNINERQVLTPDGLSDSPPTIRNQGFSIAVGIEF